MRILVSYRIGWDDLNWLEGVHMGREEGELNRSGVTGPLLRHDTCKGGQSRLHDCHRLWPDDRAVAPWFCRERVHNFPQNIDA
jgi:hypothetical protein